MTKSIHKIALSVALAITFSALTGCGSSGGASGDLSSAVSASVNKQSALTASLTTAAAAPGGLAFGIASALSAGSTPAEVASAITAGLTDQAQNKNGMAAKLNSAMEIHGIGPLAKANSSLSAVIALKGAAITPANVATAILEQLNAFPAAGDNTASKIIYQDALGKASSGALNVALASDATASRTWFCPEGLGNAALLACQADPATYPGAKFGYTAVEPFSCPATLNTADATACQANPAAFPGAIHNIQCPDGGVLSGNICVPTPQIFTE